MRSGLVMIIFLDVSILALFRQSPSNALSNSEKILEVIQKYEFPRTVISIVDLEKIRDMYPTEELLESAQNEYDIGQILLHKEEWNDAYLHFKNVLSLIERLRSPLIISNVKKVYYLSALCSIKFETPIEAVVLLKKSFLLGDESRDSFDLYETAKSEDKKKIKNLISSYRQQEISGENCRYLIDYLLNYPLPERIHKAKSILRQCLDRNSEDYIAQFGFAKCYMAEGLHEEAIETVKKIENNLEIREELRKWQKLLGNIIDRNGLIFKESDDASLDTTDVVNRGFDLFANAIYNEALIYFHLALKQSPSDPFALFGLALILWKYGQFGLAKREIGNAIERLSENPLFEGL